MDTDTKPKRGRPFGIPQTLETREKISAKNRLRSNSISRELDLPMNIRKVVGKNSTRYAVRIKKRNVIEVQVGTYATLQQAIAVRDEILIQEGLIEAIKEVKRREQAEKDAHLTESMRLFKAAKEQEMAKKAIDKKQAYRSKQDMHIKAQKEKKATIITKKQTIRTPTPKLPPPIPPQPPKSVIQEPVYTTVRKDGYYFVNGQYLAVVGGKQIITTSAESARAIYQRGGEKIVTGKNTNTIPVARNFGFLKNSL